MAFDLEIGVRPRRYEHKGEPVRIRFWAGVVRLCLLVAVLLAGLGVPTAQGSPLNDHFANRIDLGNPALVNTAGNNFGATLQASEPDSLGIGGASVWWSWTAPSDGWFEFNTMGSTADTVLYVSTGVAIDALTEVGANDDDHGGALRSRLNIEAVSGVTYQIAVHGYLGSEGVVVLEIKSIATPPVNDNFAGKIDLGNSLIVSASGSNVGATREGTEPESLDYGGASVWWSWTAPSNGWFEVSTLAGDLDTVVYVYTGATLGGLTEVDANDDDSGDAVESRLNFEAVSGVTYHIAVHGFFGFTGAVQLDLKSILVPPVNDDFTGRIVIANPVVNPVLGNNIGATMEGFEPDSLDVGGASLWWSWTAPSSGWVEVHTVGSGVDTVLYVFTGSTLDGLVEVASNDDWAGVDTRSGLKLLATMGTTYQIAVHGYDGDNGDPEDPEHPELYGVVSLNIVVPTVTPPANDLFANRVDLGNAVTTTAAGTNVGATIEGTEPDFEDVGGSSVWWEWTSPVTGTVIIDTIGSDFDTVLYVYGGEDVNTLEQLAYNDDLADPGDQSKVEFPVTAGVSYKIAVNGWHGPAGVFEGTIALNVTANDDFLEGANLGVGAVAHGVGGNIGAGTEVGEPDSLGAGGASVWWNWTAGAGVKTVVNTYGSTMDTVLYVYTGATVGGLTEIARNDDAGGTLQSRLQFTAVGGQKYRIAVHGKGGATGSIQFQVSQLTPYQTWVAKYPSLVGPAALQSADSDGDGLRNLVELALGTDPTVPSAVSSADPNGGNVPEMIDTPGMLELRYRLNAENLVGGVGDPITVSGIWSLDLGTWNVVAPVSLGGDLYKVEVPIDGARKFLTLMVEEN